MTTQAEIALLVSSYQRPRHLELCLHSIACQRGVEGRMEVVVTDDGSSDHTPELVQRFARQADFPVHFTTHPHDGFQLARCRNEGVRASRAPYLLFLDSDCVLPPEHVRVHLEQRRRGTVNGSDCLYLPPAASQGIDEDLIRRGLPQRMAPLRERWRVWREHLDSELNWLLRHPHKPKLFGNNIALWRQDLEAVNGFDQRFRHWGGEDDDLRLRLRQQGLTIRSIRHLTRTLHLWHPPAPSAPKRWSEGKNTAYLKRGFRLSRCRRGLMERGPTTLACRVLDGGRHATRIARWLPFITTPAESGKVEVEFLFLPGGGRFSGQAQCNVLVLTEPTPSPPLAQAHIVISDQEELTFDPQLQIPLEQFQRLWELL